MYTGHYNILSIYVCMYSVLMKLAYLHNNDTCLYNFVPNHSLKMHHLSMTDKQTRRTSIASLLSLTPPTEGVHCVSKNDIDVAHYNFNRFR